VTVVFAGGGTGGHLYPAIAIADALRARGAAITFAGSADRLETRIVPAAGYPLATIAAHALPRRPTLQLLRAAAHNLAGTFQSLLLLARLQPNLVVATGGYVCFPVVLAARIRRALGLSRAPIALLEPNVSPGITARALAPLVDEIWGVCTGFARRLQTKCYATGVPVRYRREDLAPRADAAARLKLDPGKRTLLVLGGSQGAHTINLAVVQLLADGLLPVGWQVLLLSGAFGTLSDRLRSLPIPVEMVVVPYLNDMGDAYAVADIVLARAGASTLAELSALNLPAILVPYPFATEAHQAENAARFAASGAAVVVDDAQLETGMLSATLARCLNAERLAQLQAAAQTPATDALSAVLARVEALLYGKSEP
jgi:UDP-N-acetylglucosamine--N-acetylmuramyl-(pentapeptide) pyrophosphoryl-undecaprenol N-acetylglucosamine transferase